MATLSAEQIQEYCDNGILVIENVFTDEEVTHIREGLHAQLQEHGMNHERLLAGLDVPPSGTRLKSESASFFYRKWKLDAQLNERVYRYAKDLLVRTYGQRIAGFDHPFGTFNQVLAYMDRINYRLPDHIRAEGGLGLHLDRNPIDPYLQNSTGLKKWRPIQGLITLTDHYGANCGGLQVVRGFHKRIDDYFRSSRDDPIYACGGEFTRLVSKNHTALSKLLETIQAPLGSLIMWDNRLPHATCEHLLGNETREVIYTAYLPDVTLNRAYWQEQAKNLGKNIHPPAYIKDPKAVGDRDWDEKDLNELQKQLLLNKG